jgi:hypothetical protein
MEEATHQVFLEHSWFLQQRMPFAKELFLFATGDV